MTIKHMVEGLMQATKSSNHSQAAMKVGLEPAVFSRIMNGKAVGMRIETLDQVQRESGVPIETLFAWFRLPPEVVLGRIAHEARP